VDLSRESIEPLLARSPLPFQAPRFDRIHSEDFLPAFETAITEHLAEVDRIANDPAPPTFENTFVALERSGRSLSRVRLAFDVLSSANSDEVLQRTEEAVAPKLAAHDDAIHLNTHLFARVDAVFNGRVTLGLDPESFRLVEVLHQEFVLAGARLPDADKARLRALNEEDAELAARFTNHLLAAARDGALVVWDRAELDGLPAADVEAAARAATERGLDGRWLLTLKNTTQQPPLSHLTNRNTRERLFRAGWTRCERGDANDTRAIVARLATIRAERAALLGFPTFAAWQLQDQMAETPGAVSRFLDRLVPAAVQKAREEAEALQRLIDEQKGGFALEPWDWDFYAEQLRKEKFDLDEAELAPYFELERVLQDGVFHAAERMFGLSFKERHDLPVYHPDVRVFDVIDRDGAPLALFYGDFFKRDNKNGGAWMNVLVPQSTLLDTRPVIYNVCNFMKRGPGQPVLISLDDVETLFHEFGHALHGLLAEQRYPSLSGTAVARDFLEFPSQFNEHPALDPDILARYAVHHETGQPIPASLVEKIKRAATFNQGYALTEILGAAVLDQRWHTLRAGTTVADVDQFERQALAEAGFDLPAVPPRYRSSYFLHIWANGYWAGYYAYLWAEMLDEDAFAWFGEHGGLTRANGDRYRALVLSRGNTIDNAVMYREFRGRDPVIEPMLARRGLTAGV
jgi:peptidyl-dipeptidase Dcp